jgi:predicted DNA-binding transcriptional regulator AlpA
MLQAVKKALQLIIDNIDSGNSNLTEEECITIVDTIKRLSQKERLISKYQAYTYLNVSRATFDRMVQEGRLPKGKKIAGFKELFWNERQIKDYIKK